MKIEIKLPTSWNELTTAQMLYVFFLIAEGYNATAIRTFCLLRWGGITVLQQAADGRWLIEKDGQRGYVTAGLIADTATTLAFLDVPPAVPARPEVFNGHQALPADFMGVPFEKFLCIDNLYQGWLHTEDAALIAQMADILYETEGSKLTKVQEVAVCYWVISLKKMFANRFRHFFQPVTTTDNLLDVPLPSPEKIQEAMDTQIRALTKGDITKEAEVLQLDTWRALTELNAQAKEYEELRRMYKA